MAEKVAIVTGASSGLGYQLVLGLLDSGWNVHGVSRRKVSLSSSKYKHHCLDLSSPGGVESYFKSSFASLLDENIEHLVLINDAGTIQPVGDPSGHSLEKLSASMNLNCVVPQWLMGFFRGAKVRKYDVVNISSGAANKPYQGWGSYCSGKAALKMASQVMAFENPGMRVLSYAPGVIDTPMQAEVRSSSEEAFPSLSRFVGLFEQGELIDPTLPAQEIIDFVEGSLSGAGFHEFRYGDNSDGK